jgi:hypothetical protein
LHFIATCIEHQTDFISGVGNKFSQRNCKKDDHSDFRTCIMIDILERFLQQIILHRSAFNRITSTQAGKYIRATDGQNADCDSMLLISLCYGKQTVISEDRGTQKSASADGMAGPAIDGEIVLTDVEQALLTYDLGLRETDAAWHSPLMVFAQMRIMKNRRIRSKESENWRRARWEERNIEYRENREDRKAECRERHDSVPPLRRDSFRNADASTQKRSRPMSRNPSRDRAESRQPREPLRPPPVKAPPTPPQRAPSTPPQPPPVKAPPVPPPRLSRGTTPPWQEHEERLKLLSRVTPGVEPNHGLLHEHIGQTLGGIKEIRLLTFQSHLHRRLGASQVNNGLMLVFQIHQSLHLRAALAVMDIFRPLFGEKTRATMWWNLHRAIMLRLIVGCNDKMALGLIFVRKHQIRASFSISRQPKDGKINFIFTVTHSQWAYRSA